MILDVQIWNYHIKKHVFHQWDEVSVVNSFVPENMWAISTEDEKVVYKVQQCLTVKHAVNVDGVLLESFIDGIMIFKADGLCGVTMFLTTNSTSLTDGDVNGNFTAFINSDLDFMDKFKVVDYSVFPGKKRKEYGIEDYV